MERKTLILVRHGRPDLSRNVRLTAQGYRDWWERYDTVGLREGQSVPPRIAEIVDSAETVVSSPLPRALATATLALKGDAPDAILPALVEAPLPPPSLGPLKFRPLTWGTISRILWMAGRSAGGESVRTARQRARSVARELDMMADAGPVVVFAHGWFNRMVGTQLKREGWRCVAGRGDSYWSYRRWEKVQRDG